jgi:ferredoxin
MAYVVTSKCVGCKDTSCVPVCPVDCFHEGENMLVIDPDVCIDCGLCEPECPHDAIYPEYDIPEDEVAFVEVNDMKSKDWPIIYSEKEPLSYTPKYTTLEAIEIVLVD